MPFKTLLFKKSIYRKDIENDYDVEIAFLEGPITRLFSIKNNKTRKIAWIHNDIGNVFGKGLKSKIKKIIDKKIYSKYEKLVFVSNDNKEKFEKIYKLNNEKQVIYNYINEDEVIKKSNEKIDLEFDKNTINIVTVARLVEQKAIDRLIEVHASLIKQGLSHKIYVIGDGPQKETLNKMIKQNNVENTFILLGQKENPYPYIKMADYFALLSKYEGYPMVLLEAKILGKDILITDTAAREVIQNYKNSYVFENTSKGIEQGLKEILENKKIVQNTQANDSIDQNEESISKIKNLID